MALPKYDELLQPVLEALKDGNVLSAKELRAKIAQNLLLTKAQLSEMLPSGKQLVFNNRVHWAAFYLKKAELVETPKKGQYKITAAGQSFVDTTIVTLNVLKSIPAFVDFFYGQGNNHDLPIEPAEGDDQDIPLETLAKAYESINSQLVDELLDTILSKSPDFFEKLVVDLLLGMGYGGALDHPGQVVGKVGDEGIDGIIREDKLGFSKIYIQAKRWDKNQVIGRPEIQKFVGALVGQQANKGLFITTAKYSDKAREYADTQSALKVVLVDGQMLTRLMIENGIGVSEQATYVVRKIDSDYFEDD